MTDPTPTPSPVDRLIREHAAEVRAIYENRTAGDHTFVGFLAHFLAAVSPVIRRQVAEEIAADLAPEEADRPYFGDTHWNALKDAAAIARTHAHPEEKP